MTSKDRAPAISLMLAVPDETAAVEWYKRALGARELWNLGSVVGLEIEGAPFFLARPERPDWATPEKLGGTCVRIEVFCDDPDAFVACAVKAGAWARSGVRDHQMPWGTHSPGRLRRSLRAHLVRRRPVSAAAVPRVSARRSSRPPAGADAVRG